MRKPDRARPEAPAAEPEAPLGAGGGPGVGLTGALPPPEPPCPPPAGGLAAATREASAVDKPTEDSMGRR